ncbi:thioesterase II family protein [Streptomyces chilikensis]|uniref:Alpha/beta fold hydrolase n=1 Tax=Streptomyces chilikensis TaxID=1194079 RepID=A0ABV3EUI3_9ACTN|nr:alpha/beta fold hydrolase [Streptomyces chilikensis]
MAAPEVDPTLWLRRFGEAPGRRTRLVCLPHAGGSATFFFPVARALSPALDVISVQYPGRQDRRHEKCVETLQELARQIVDVLSPGPDDPPTALFGHSLGATLGFEMARLMEARGAAPVHLFASGRRAPSRPRHETVHLRDDEGMLAELRLLSGTDPRVLGDEEVLRMSLPAIRGDYRAAETYVYEPGPALSCPITVFTGDDDPKVTLDEARAWEEHTDAGFAMHTYAGGHFFLSNHQTAMLKIISDRLATATTGSR